MHSKFEYSCCATAAWIDAPVGNVVVIGFEQGWGNVGRRGNKDETQLSRIVKTRSSAAVSRTWTSSWHAQNGFMADDNGVARVCEFFSYSIYLHVPRPIISVSHDWKEKKENKNLRWKSLSRNGQVRSFRSHSCTMWMFLLKLPGGSYCRVPDRLLDKSSSGSDRFKKNCTRRCTIKFCQLSNKHNCFTLQCANNHPTPDNRTGTQTVRIPSTLSETETTTEFQNYQ